MKDLETGKQPEKAPGQPRAVMPPSALPKAGTGGRKNLSDRIAHALTVGEHLPGASLTVYLLLAVLVVFWIWASLFDLDEVVTGTGKIVPTSKDQLIQSLEGGILTNLRVHEGDMVNVGQVLAQLDRTRTASAVGESESRMRAAQATIARLRAELNNAPLVFPPEVLKDPELVKSETSYYHSRKQGLNDNLAAIDNTLRLIRNELDLTEPLAAKGAASQVEVLRLRRQVSELQAKKVDLLSQYQVKAREELSKAEAEMAAQKSITEGREDSLNRLTLQAPVRGVVKDIQVNSVGGIIPPNGTVMSIVPSGEQLLVEVHVSPRDIAFIHPGQEAIVKVSAYDYSIYGGLKGRVSVISPDTIQDEIKKDNYYYRIYIRTASDQLKNKAGKAFPIVPGMVVTADIKSGSKSIMNYLLKPFNKANEALRER